MTQLATKQAPPSALTTMANRLGADPGKLLNTLKATVFRGANDEELLALCIVANEFRLNPLTKQIYAFKPKDKEGREVGSIQPIVSVDGWIKIINEHPDFDGMEFEDEDDEMGKPIAKTCVLYRKSCSRPTKIRERFSECYRNTAQWNTMPHRMLRHKSLIQAGRVAFGLSGIYDEDEGRDIIRNVEATIIADAPKKPLFKERSLPRPEDREIAEDVAEIAQPKGRKQAPPLTLEGQTEEELAREAEDKLWQEADQDGGNAA